MPSTAGGVIGPNLCQVFRRVIQVCDMQDMFFEGKQFFGTPSTWQYIQEFLRPGKQITTHPTGEQQLHLVYAGFLNLLTPLPKIGNLLPASWTKQYNLGTPPSPFTIGRDPIPNVKLYGNPRADFVMVGGTPPPIAVGAYNQTLHQLTLPIGNDRQRLIDRLRQPKPSRN